MTGSDAGRSSSTWRRKNFYCQGSARIPSPTVIPDKPENLCEMTLTSNTGCNSPPHSAASRGDSENMSAPDVEASDIDTESAVPSDAESGPIGTPRSPPRHLRPLYASIDLPEEDDGENHADTRCPTPPSSRASLPWQWLSSAPASRRVIDETFVFPLFVNALGLY